MADDTAHRVVVAFPPLDGRSVSATHQWFAVRVRPRFEKKAEVHITALGFAIETPLMQQTKIKRRLRWGRWYEEKRTESVRAFPGYVFVTFDVANPSWRLIPHGEQVKNCRIRFFWHSPERPQPIPQRDMERIMAASRDRAMTPEQVQSLIELGIAYRVTDGPFAGQVGPAEAVHGETVRLGLSLFGRPTPVPVPVGQVERVEAQG